MSINKIKYSIVCASRNEERDIIHLLESFVNMNSSFTNSELLIIDDSEDSTPAVVKKWSKQNKNIIYIKGNNQGCCEARNLGIRKAKGEYIIFMTADSFLTDSLIPKIDHYYSLGYDAVMLNSRVANLDSIWSKFLDCWHKHKIHINPNFSPLTTQGYSVRKTSAIKVGLIDHGVYKPNICRDWTLITKMDRQKMKKIFVKNIYCDHFAPATAFEFILTHITRGEISAGYAVKFNKFSLLYCFCRVFVKLIIVLFEFFVPIRAIKKTIGMIKFTDKKYNFFTFYCLFHLKSFCFIYGEINTFFKFKRGYYS